MIADIAGRREDFMKKELVRIFVLNMLITVIVTTAAVLVTIFCMKDSAARDRAGLAAETESCTEESAKDSCTDESFEKLSSQYAKLVYQYNHAMYLYCQEDIEKNEDIESVLDQSAQVISDMEELEQGQISPEDAEEMSDAMDIISRALTIVSEGLENAA